MTILNHKDLIYPQGLYLHQWSNRFKAFDMANPDVYYAIMKEIEKALDKGLTKFSIKTIIGNVRWAKTLETVSNDGFKINDAYTALYARVIIYNYPFLVQYIDTRSFRGPKLCENLF